jgi:hypothetical protein
MKNVLLNAELYAAVKKAYFEGENITDFLKCRLGIEANIPEIIEIAYHLQSGSYIEYLADHGDAYKSYCAEISSCLSRFLTDKSVLLDVGSGELVTITGLLGQLTQKPASTYVCDLSYSRLLTGVRHFEQICPSVIAGIVPVVADMFALPFMSKSISITTSSHALEPNGGRVYEILTELFRVTSDLLVLFEPCYECGSLDIKQRMDRLGYIKGISDSVHDLGGRILELFPLKTCFNPLNPTHCFVIEPPRHTMGTSSNIDFTVPGSDFQLVQTETGLFSSETGLFFPMIGNIPVLRLDKSVMFMQ